MLTVQPGQHRLNFRHSQDHGQTSRSFGAGDVLQPTEVLLQHVAVKKQDGVHCLILGGGRHVFLDGQVSQKGLDFSFAHLLGMTLVMEQDEALDPAQISLFCADTVVLEADQIPYLVQQFRLLSRGRRLHAYISRRQVHENHFFNFNINHLKRTVGLAACYNTHCQRYKKATPSCRILHAAIFLLHFSKMLMYKGADAPARGQMRVVTRGLVRLILS